LVQHANRLAGMSAVPDRPLGVSLGLAIYDGASPEPLERIVARADAGMYQAKSLRRSGFVIAGDEVFDRNEVFDGDAA
jgi:GGDEF domain-containing protein